MNIHGTDSGYKITFERDYSNMSEEVSEIVPISIVIGFVIFLILI